MALVSKHWYEMQRRPGMVADGLLSGGETTSPQAGRVTRRTDGADKDQMMDKAQKPWIKGLHYAPVSAAQGGSRMP